MVISYSQKINSLLKLTFWQNEAKPCPVLTGNITFTLAAAGRLVQDLFEPVHVIGDPPVGYLGVMLGGFNTAVAKHLGHTLDGNAI